MLFSPSVSVRLEGVDEVRSEPKGVGGGEIGGAAAESFFLLADAELLAAGGIVPAANTAGGVAIEVLPHGLLDALHNREDEPFLLIGIQRAEGAFLLAAKDVGGFAFYVQDDADAIGDLVFDLLVEGFGHNVVISVTYEVVTVLAFEV